METYYGNLLWNYYSFYLREITHFYGNIMFNVIKNKLKQISQSKIR